MKHNKSVIPGKNLTLGISVSMLSIFILIPLISVLIYSIGVSFDDLIKLLTTETVISAFKVSFKCSFIASVINAVFGVILAWVIVKYDFPCKRIIDGLIELPFALPTAVAGITLTNLYSDNGVMGKFFANFNISIAYTQIGIVIAMVFIGIPFVVRTVQPVLEKLDPQYQEASEILGASRFNTFIKVILPELMPSILAGFGLAFARGVGEYGSVVFISGNKPNKTQIVSMLIMNKLNAGTPDYEGATVIALVMLIISFILLFIINTIQTKASKISEG